MTEDDKKIRELEKEFRSIVVSELREIKNGQSDLESCVEKLDKKLDLNIQKLEYELQNVSKLDESQNRMLDEHMKRSDTLEKMLLMFRKEMSARIEALEQPYDFIKYLGKVAAWSSAILGLVIVILKILGKW